ncbi:GntR family transcriptional regulator [Streptomyces specialis]|uniref:GntR family transcriptional regulator n=1 Tax=Streptomyces specialis TaxID=498367 RepID=UPI00099EBD4C
MRGSPSRCRPGRDPRGPCSPRHRLVERAVQGTIPAGAGVVRERRADATAECARDLPASRRDEPGRDRPGPRPCGTAVRQHADGEAPRLAHSEGNLCARFGRSRTAVRSALDKLEGAGLLERSPGKPRVVRALPQRHTSP